MAEPTLEKELTDNEVAPEVQKTNSEDTKVWDDKYPKWQKMLPKEYWGDEKLAKYESLRAVIEDATNPKKPETPESYELKGIEGDVRKALEEAYKGACLSAENAEKITSAVSGAIPKKNTEESLKEIVGLADYEVEKAYFESAVNKVCGGNQNIADALLKSDLRYNPAVFNVLSLVGKNLGEGNFEDFSNNTGGAPKKGVWEEMVGRPKDFKDRN